MTYEVILSDKSKKFILRLSFSEQEKILNKLYSIVDNPFSYLKRLHGSNFWRLRIEKYRLVLDIVVKGKKIYVVRAGFRKNIY